MSKGLEELNKIKTLDILYDIEMTENGEEYMKEQNINLSLIEKDLEEREKMLEEYGVNSYEEWDEITLKANVKYHELKEVLDIIKKKKVNMKLFLLASSYDLSINFGLGMYNNDKPESEQLNEEEFNLIKEWLKK